MLKDFQVIQFDYFPQLTGIEVKTNQFSCSLCSLSMNDSEEHECDAFHIVMVVLLELHPCQIFLQAAIQIGQLE